MTGWIDKLPKWLVWEVAVPLTLFNVWLLLQGVHYFQHLLSVFVVATLLAFLLDYLVDAVERIAPNRGVSVAVIVLMTLGVVGLGVFAIAPILLDQVTDLATQLPNWLASGTKKLEVIDSEIDKLQASKNIDVSGLSVQLANLLPVELKLLPGQLLDFLMGFADKLLDVLLTAVLTLYLLLYGKSFWQGLFKWLPNNLGQQVSTALGSQFKSYFFGQAVVATIMGGTLSLIFLLLSVPFWLVFGLFIGLSVLFPFGDWLAMALVSLAVGTSDPWLGLDVLLACVVTDQIIDNVLTPRILGDAVGLNPVWVLISILVGIQTGGVLGAVVAVPLAATLKQIVDSFGVDDVKMEELEAVDLSAS
ncbi:MAG: AI-2E family transporter [Leptolyngbya foveolarum]|uniref:AI-2E family transporter n=1 Tax=Leptolyngbya foveolarum TaxID=47253 RepID=A0A2W4TID8_9CYAN|nr:MAG: AI-2E family transporter [Leptolyngbya foveolarum]